MTEEWNITLLSKIVTSIRLCCTFVVIIQRNSCLYSGSYYIMKLNESKEEYSKNNKYVSSSGRGPMFIIFLSSLLLHPMKGLIQSRFLINAE